MNSTRYHSSDRSRGERRVRIRVPEGVPKAGIYSGFAVVAGSMLMTVGNAGGAARF